MQISQSSSLVTAMAKYCTAVRNMEQTVMFPSFLRDVPTDSRDGAATMGTGDLYEHYIKLKSIRDRLEHGPVPANEGQMVACDADNETLFYYHLTELFTILHRLTKQTQVLTSKYKDLIGSAQGANGA
ncbi:hypothetical protein GDO86_003974 [Hymenochirus boettgeri]|uniref:Uncharacterized protein n=1 Tax=Hymenochirus boettgeri TaxID=247094 RepID=A0A8T2K8M8_9PIPI|nr:hypothetical protein GDO86_003974 [Hymenochirus boettgeri]